MRKKRLSDSQTLDRMNLLQTHQIKSSEIADRRMSHQRNYAPRIGRVAPLGAPNHVDTVVHIFGVNFEGGDLYKCKFGDVTVPAVFNATRHEIVCSAPSQPDIRGVIPLHVVIFNYANHRVHHRASADRGFRYYDANAPDHVPILISISPSSGSVSGGTRVTVKGEGFVHTENLRCKFGSEIVVPIKYEPHRATHSSPHHTDPSAVLSETMICIAPSYARKGLVPFRLENLDGVQAARRLEYQYMSSLSSNLLSISDSSFNVPITGGVTSSIVSKSTLPKAIYRCRFGGRVVTRGWLVSKTNVLCLVPAEINVVQSTTFQIVRGECVALYTLILLTHTRYT